MAEKDKIIKRLEWLENKTGNRRSGVFIIEQKTGKITCEGKEYSLQEYEKIKNAPGSRITTIIDDIPKYTCVWGDQVKPGEKFEAEWQGNTEEVEKNEQN